MSCKFAASILVMLTILLLAGCVTSVDPALPYDELPTITVATAVQLVASPSHPTSYLEDGEIASGTKVRLIGADEDAAWLLVLDDGQLGWMPTIFSETNVGAIRPAIVGEPLSDKCFKVAGVLTEINEPWPSNINGAALVVGSLYRPAVGDDFDEATLVLNFSGPGSVVASDYVHTPLTSADALALFAFSVAELSDGSAITFELQGSGDESPAFQAIIFEDVCRGQPAQLTLGPFKRIDHAPIAIPTALSAEAESDAPTQDAGNVTPTPVVLKHESQAEPTATPVAPILVPGEPQVGNLAQDEVNRYILEGHANTPLLISLERTSGDLCYYVAIWDAYDEVIEDWGRFCDGQQRFSFTPPRTETLTLAVIQNRAGGDYSLIVDWLDVPPDERNQDNEIEPGAQISGNLGRWAWDEWIIEGFENTPLLWQVERTSGDLCYYVNIYDSFEERLGSWGRYCGDLQKFSFTPPRTETLTVQVYADRSYGSYSLAVDWLDGPPEEDGAVNTLEPGIAVAGSLGVEAYDDYTLDGYKNVPLLFEVERTRGDLCYYVNVFDSEEERLKYWGRYCGGEQKFSFTPPRTESLTVRVYADNNFGDYSLLVDWLDGSPEEREQIQPLEPSIQQSGRLGIEAYDDFSIDGYENVPLLFNVERTRGDLCYYVSIFDSDDERLEYWGRFCGGPQKFSFTPPRTEPLTVRVYADNNYGDYALQVDWLDGPPKERNLQLPLEPGIERNGRLGVGSYDDYILEGFENTPFLYTVERTRGDLCYYVNIYDAQGERLEYWGRYCSGQQKFAYTPPRTETLTVRVYADNNYGDYALQADWLDTLPEERNQLVELKTGVEQTGRLGVGSWDDYQFNGIANANMKLKVERTKGDLCYYISLYDSSRERLKYWGRNCGGMLKIEYPLPDTGLYTIRVYADSAYGDYTLTLDAP